MTAGLTIFLRSISPRKRRKLDLNSVATRGIWSLALPGGPADHLLVTSDHASSKVHLSLGDRADPLQMVCRIAGVSGLDVETQDATVTVATILAGAGVVRVTPTSIILSDRSACVQIDDPADALQTSLCIRRSRCRDPPSCAPVCLTRMSW